jgi:hypothetical protein
MNETSAMLQVSSDNLESACLVVACSILRLERRVDRVQLFAIHSGDASPWSEWVEKMRNMCISAIMPLSSEFIFSDSSVPTQSPADGHATEFLWRRETLQLGYCRLWLLAEYCKTLSAGYHI